VYLYDWIVLGIAAAFVVRGWRRGLVREAVEVAVLVGGAVVVFRLAPAVGTILAGMANVPYEAARLAGGVVLFFALIIGGALVSRVIAGALKIMPGATALNRLGGSLIGFAYAAVVVVLATTLLAVAPLSEGVRASIEERMLESRVGSELLEADGEVQQIVASLSGESIFGSVIAVRQAVGDRLAAGTIPVPFPSVDRSDLSSKPAIADDIFDALNVHRIQQGLLPLAFSADLAPIAESRALRVYLSGVLALDDRLAADLSGAAVPGTIHTDMVVIAASGDGASEAILDAAGYSDKLEDSVYRTAAVGVIDGPYGLITVVVLAA
jgi:uncharacterized membrane protein required for colicin V production